ncbi:MAG: TatD family hydrolase [Planctomycetota bacterium]
MRLVDIGVNLVSRQFESDRPAVVERAREHGVERMVLTGTTLEVSRAAAALAAADAGAWSTAGVHPHHASEWDDATGEAIEALCARDEVVAVGECGLDFNRNYSPREDQLRAFEAQLEIASRVGLPVFVHQRDAHAELLAMLRSAWPDLARGAVVHCFTEGPDEAADYLELGCALGVTGWVCDERRGGALRDAVPAIPAERLMLETDAPYLLPRTIEPKPETRRNEPMHLPWVLREVAKLRGEEPAAVATSAWTTTNSFFGLGAD